MNNSDMATCIICGKQYKTCLSCKDQDVIKPWRNITDSVEHYKIFLVISQYNNGYIKKDVAKKQLESIKYNKNDLRISVQDKIEEIMSSMETSKKAVITKNNATKKCE